MADLTAWRALVDKELAGAPFEKLVQSTPEGIAIQPLYAERPAELPFARGAAGPGFSLCMRVESGGNAGAELDAGADAVWVDAYDVVAVSAATRRGKIAISEPRYDREARERALARIEEERENDEGSPTTPKGEVWVAVDFIGDVARGLLPPSAIAGSPLPMLVSDALLRGPWRSVRVTTLPFHDAGADAADELALGLASLAATLRQLDAAKIDLARIGPLLWAQVAVGRDTFGELCKLRALRVVWHKLLAAAGVHHTGLDAMHAVCSSRTIAERDPWVNMLRVTTQVFAAALGGAQLVTPLPFDAAYAEKSALGQRVARNTALVLREESGLGRVLDAAGGSYYIEARTDALARAAWARFQEIEKGGGIVPLLESGQLAARLATAWKQRTAAIGKRKEPVLGVSEFANLRERLPGTPTGIPGVVREAAPFEALRTKIEAAPRSVALVTLGPPAEHRARVGFAESFFAVAGVEARPGEAADVAVLCGSDERYATEAADTAKRLRAAGVKRVVLAGRPGALEADLRAAGVDAFIFVGCDALATLTEVLS